MITIQMQFFAYIVFKHKIFHIIIYQIQPIIVYFELITV